MESCITIPLGMTGFVEAHQLQNALHQKVVTRELPHLLLLTEHAHVFTQGRRANKSDVLVNSSALLELGVAVIDTDRGGQTTYHGPGQLVVYPIINLKTRSMRPLDYVQRLEFTISSTLAEFGIEGTSMGKPTGVWVEDAKIAAIGVKVSRGVTTHGFALNVKPDIGFFEHIIPCGMADSRTTSMDILLPDIDVQMDQIISSIANSFSNAFELSLEWRTVDEIKTALSLEEDRSGLSQ